jgi:O-antigen/teichoic acid export membrane protein
MFVEFRSFLEFRCFSEMYGFLCCCVFLFSQPNLNTNVASVVFGACVSLVCPWISGGFSLVLKGCPLFSGGSPWLSVGCPWFSGSPFRNAR